MELAIELVIPFAFVCVAKQTHKNIFLQFVDNRDYIRLLFVVMRHIWRT